MEKRETKICPYCGEDIDADVCPYCNERIGNMMENNIASNINQSSEIQEEDSAEVQLLLSKGLNLFEKGNYKEAVEFFEKAAKMGSDKGRMLLGVCYFYGKGVQQSYTETINCVKGVAAKGNVDAEFLMAECYNMEDSPIKNEMEAYRWYDKAASHGHQEAKSKMRDIELSKDKSKLYKEGRIEWVIVIDKAEQGDTDAQIELGNFYSWYEDDRGYEILLEWYRSINYL